VSAAEESWRPVLGFEGWYEVSDLGRVRRIRKPGGAPIARILRPGVDTWGYLNVRLSRPGARPRTLSVHLLVADAFIGPRAPGLEIDHKSGDKNDCRLTNLEPVTHSENLRRSHASGRRRPWGSNRVAASMLLAGRGSAGVS